MAIWVAARADAQLGTTHFGVSRQGESGALRQYAPAWHAPGARVICTGREIPQVGETYGVVGVHSAEGWGLESGVNEHALAVGGEALSTREPAEASPGLTEHDLVRLALERGRHAREALEVLAALVERFGYGAAEPRTVRGGSDHRFYFADPGEVWCLECSGRRWAARRVTRRLPRHPQVAPEIGDDWEIGSKGLETYARERHWWEGPGRLDFAAVYGGDATAARDDTRGEGPRTPVGRAELETRFREAGAASATFHVALPHDRRRPWPLWVSGGPAAVGIFLPVYLDAPLPVETGNANAFDVLARCADGPAELAGPRLREAWKGFEADLERERREVEREAAALFNAERDSEARLRLGDWSSAVWAQAAARAGELADALQA